MSYPPELRQTYHGYAQDPLLPEDYLIGENAVELGGLWNTAFNRIREIQQVVENASLRIQFKYPNAHESLDLHYGSSNKFLDINSVWFTDHPELIYTNPVVYHVGCSRGLNDLCAGKSLLPPAVHRDFGIRTHKGVGLEIVSRLLEAAGEDLGAKDSAVWAGRYIDNEQVRIEQDIARMGESVDDRLIDLFLISLSKQKTIKPQFRNAVETISRGEKPKDVPELRSWVDETMEEIFRLTGRRFSFYDSLRRFFLGEIPGYDNFHSDSLDSLISGIIFLYGVQFRGILNEDLTTRQIHLQQDNKLYPAQAVVLAIDLPHLQNRVLSRSPYPLFIGNSPRDPDESIPMPSVELSDIKRVYAWTPEEINEASRRTLQQAGIPLEPLESIPADKLLDPDQPVRLDRNIIDPERSLCARRYQDRPQRQKKWRKILTDGLIVPLEFRRIWRFTQQWINTNETSLFDICGDELVVDNPSEHTWRKIRRSFMYSLRLGKFCLPGLMGNIAG